MPSFKALLRGDELKVLRAVLTPPPRQPAIRGKVIFGGRFEGALVKSATQDFPIIHGYAGKIHPPSLRSYDGAEARLEPSESASGKVLAGRNILEGTLGQLARLSVPLTQILVCGKAPSKIAVQVAEKSLLRERMSW